MQDFYTAISTFALEIVIIGMTSHFFENVDKRKNVLISYRKTLLLKNN